MEALEDELTGGKDLEAVVGGPETRPSHAGQLDAFFDRHRPRVDLVEH